MAQAGFDPNAATISDSGPLPASARGAQLSLGDSEVALENAAYRPGAQPSVGNPQSPAVVGAALTTTLTAASMAALATGEAAVPFEAASVEALVALLGGPLTLGIGAAVAGTYLLNQLAEPTSIPLGGNGSGGPLIGGTYGGGVTVGGDGTPPISVLSTGTAESGGSGSQPFVATPPTGPTTLGFPIAQPLPAVSGFQIDQNSGRAIPLTFPAAEQLPNVLPGGAPAQVGPLVLTTPTQSGVPALLSVANQNANEAGPSFTNQLPGELAGEVAAAHALGVTPIQAGSPDFESTVNNGPVKYIVTQSGDVTIAPYSVDGIEISHAAIASGEPVRAAGVANIVPAGDGTYIGLTLDTQSGHYLKGATPAQNAAADMAAREAFRKIGITFPGEAP